MRSITISITIPEQLEQYLQRCADDSGISRSRKIGNILLAWQKEELANTGSSIANNCSKLGNKNICNEFHYICNASLAEALSCEGYTLEVFNI